MANVKGKLFGFIGKPDSRPRKTVKSPKWKQR